eukprot:CAMPEP_0185854504 /NCGR_PEP_ID=MMETSP1354-20130828/22598_1 /TAXON_ID=708628 /ORGANISM="Erythrolobus madagascarensis, Strain CCMP3276" /LENGTH=136 /DNA_ID=CAMNT_0028556279 /DNA_START=174 /DNA_END=580 /DNA_ORIENTATION=-
MAFSIDTIQADSGLRPLLFASFQFPNTFTDRFTRSMHGPIYIVAANRGTGVVHIRELARDGDPSLTVQHTGLAPKPLCKSIEMLLTVNFGGNVTVNLMSHLGFPRVSALFDGLMWIGEFITEAQEFGTTGKQENVP